MKSTDYQNLSQQLITQLQQGTAPWQKPWVYDLPFNAESKNRYRGLNLLKLMMQPYKDPRWASYKQAQALGWQVRKGEESTKIVRFCRHEDKETSFYEEKGHFNSASIFNVEQMDGVPPLKYPKSPTWRELSQVEQLAQNTGARIKHLRGDRAFYRLSSDSITLPLRSQFSTKAGYYATLLHELSHWTGHPSRLNRDLAHPFGSEAYAREELRAEITSMILGQELNIRHRPEHHLSYLASWIQVLRKDPKEIQRAASAAEQMVDYLLMALADTPQAA